MVARIMSVLSDIAHKQEICREILTTLPGYGQDHAALDARITAIAPLDVFIEFDGDAALGLAAHDSNSYRVEFGKIRIGGMATLSRVATRMPPRGSPRAAPRVAHRRWMAMIRHQRLLSVSQRRWCERSKWR